jgi:hypothetical protein
LTKGVKFGTLGYILAEADLGIPKAALMRRRHCKLGVSHGNHKEQDKCLVWIAEEERELRIRTFRRTM